MARQVETNYKEIKKYLVANAGIKTKNEMSEELGISESQIAFAAHKLGISLQLNEVKNRRMEVRKAVIALHKDLTVKEVAEKMGVSKHMVSKIGLRLGVEFKKERVSKQMDIHHRSGLFNVFAHDNWLV